MTLLRGYEEWLYGLGLSGNTVDQRISFATRCALEWGTFDVTPGHLGSWLRQFHGWTARTYHIHLSSIYAWLVDTGTLSISPLERIKRPPTPKPRPRPLSWGQLTDLLDDAQTASDHRLRSFLLLGALAGLRPHEIAQHHGRNIDVSSIRVLGKGGQLATVPTHPVLWTLARDMPADSWWFPSPQRHRDHVSASLVSLRVKQTFTRHGIAGSAHRLRATYGTELQRQGVPLRYIQELLRHRHLASTEHYLGVDQTELEAAVRLLAA